MAQAFLKSFSEAAGRLGACCHASTMSEEVQAWQPHAEFIRVSQLAATDVMIRGRVNRRKGTKNRGWEVGVGVTGRGEEEPTFRRRLVASALAAARSALTANGAKTAVDSAPGCLPFVSLDKIRTDDRYDIRRGHENGAFAWRLSRDPRFIGLIECAARDKSLAERKTSGWEGLHLQKELASNDCVGFLFE